MMSASDLSDVMTCQEPGTFGSCELPAGHDGHHSRRVGAGSHSWPRSPEAERLRAEVERLREQIERNCRFHQEAEVALSDEVERLRDLIERLTYKAGPITPETPCRCGATQPAHYCESRVAAEREALSVITALPPNE